MMPRFVPLAILSGLFLITVPQFTTAQGVIHQVRYGPSDKPGELIFGVTYRVWIPEGVKKLKGVIIHQHGCGKGACEGGMTAADDLHWQALAAKWDCALLGPSFEQEDAQDCRKWCDPRNGSRARFLQALDDLAQKTGHAELATAPWCLWGHSGGAFWASLMMISDPSRIAAVWLRSGSGFSAWEKGEIPKPEIPEATYGIPTMCNPGLKERDDKRFSGAWIGAESMTNAYRSKGALIGFAPDPKTNHECGDSRYMAIPFFDTCLEMRLGEGGQLKPIDQTKGWLATDWQSEAVEFSEFKGDPAKALWLPNAAFARVWREYVTTSQVSDKTPPPAPSRLKVTKSADGKTQLNWQAAADLESGLAGFEILKDGQVIGTLPEKPLATYGKPLFQAMSYHDTPKAPVAQMQFVDQAGKADSKYQIRSINTAGLKSGFSEAGHP
ncbi:MAG: hypothetical protein NT172_14290 [Planctomycetota bacterium]|nr:hypothetical protein [Planctomycetota bacterium]